jgi:hypothetical protein
MESVGWDDKIWVSFGERLDPIPVVRRSAIDHTSVHSSLAHFCDDRMNVLKSGILKMEMSVLHEWILQKRDVE